MRITITRAFERTRQIKQFEPIKAFCSASVEAEGDSIESEIELLKVSSGQLDIFVRAEVEKTIASEEQALRDGSRTPCANCGGIQVSGGTGLSPEGLCKTCESQLKFQARDMRAEGKKSKKNQ